MEMSGELNPLISVILPFYNAENTLNRAIKSIYHQTFHDFECILVDNNSTDNSAVIAQRWADSDYRFKLLKEPKQGVVHASHTAFLASKGTYVARMDADDFSFPNRLQLQYEFLNRNSDYGVVSGKVLYIGHISNTEGFERYVDWVNSINNYKKIYLRRFVESPIINPSAMWRKELALKFGLYKDGDFPEDYEMWLRWLQEDVKIGKIDQEVLEWCDSENRLTRTNKIYSNDAFFSIKTSYLIHELKKANPFFPKVVVWGASKISRYHASFLTKYNIEIEYYIDVNKGKAKKSGVVYYEDIPKAGECFILVYIKHHQLRIKTQLYLEQKGYVEGVNYLLLS